MQGGGGGGDPMDQGYVPVHQQPYYGSSLMSHHSPPFPPGAGPDDDPYKRPRMHVSSPQEYYGAGAGAGLMGASAVDEDLRAWAQRAATGDLRGSFLFSPQQAPTSAGGAAGAGAAAMSETDAIVHRPATERPDMSIYRPIMMTGATPNSTSSIFCRDTVLNPNADHIILCMSSVIHVQMLQDEDADEELKKKFSIFDVEEGDDDRMDTGTTGPGGEVPAEAIHEFIERLFNLAHFSTECNIIALVYINRVIALTSMPLHKKNWKAVVLVALLIAQKVWDDRRIALSDFCQMCPEYTKERVRAMEHKFLELMQYRAVVTQGLYARYYFELRALFEQLLRQSSSQTARPFPLQPLRLWEARKLELVSDAFGIGREGVSDRDVRPSGFASLPPPHPPLPAVSGHPRLARRSPEEGETCPDSGQMSCASVKSDRSSLAAAPRPSLAGQLLPPQSPGVTLEDVTVRSKGRFVQS